MIVSVSKQFIFTRGVKTGSESMRSSLAPYRRWFESSFVARVARKGFGFYETWPFINFYANPHLPLVYAANVIPCRLFETYYKFGIVREPVSWMVSVYKHWLTRFAKPNEKPRTLEEFVRYWSSFRSCTQALQFVNMEGRFLADEVGRFEQLEGFHSHVCGRLGIHASLDRLNVAPSNIQVMVTRKVRSLIENVCRLDYEVFDFEDLSSTVVPVHLDKDRMTALARLLEAYGGVSYDPWASSYHGKLPDPERIA